MPELPEVETIIQQLRPRLEGREITGVKISSPRLVSSSPLSNLPRKLRGQRIEAVGRHGKYILIRLHGGNVLVAHLRLTGQLLFFEVAPEKQRFEVARISLENGSALVYGDARKFATLQLMRSDELSAYLSTRVGVDAMDDAFTPALFIEQARRSRQVAKGFLLDQKHFAGVGNIYADESLYQARVNPLRVISTLTEKEMRKLYRAVRSRLSAGIRAGGSSVSDYVQADGEEGKMQNQLKVYGRRGKPCASCGRPLLYTKVAGRGTVCCEYCQPLDPPSG